MASRKMANAHTSQQKYKPCFELSENWVILHKAQYETNTTAARGHEIYTCVTENPKLGIFWTGKKEKQEEKCV